MHGADARNGAGSQSLWGEVEWECTFLSESLEYGVPVVTVTAESKVLSFMCILKTLNMHSYRLKLVSMGATICGVLNEHLSPATSTPVKVYSFTRNTCTMCRVFGLRDTTLSLETRE